MSFTLLTIIALAGSAGAAARFSIDTLVAIRLKRPSPWSTFIVNLTGSLAIGLLVALNANFDMPPTLFTAAAFGFLGAYTTFSTWMHQAAVQLNHRRYAHAIANLLGSTALGVLAVVLGLALAGLVSG